MLSDLEILRAACCVAGLDGEVCGKELRHLRRLADRVGVGSASLSAMVEQAESDPAFYEEQFALLAADPDRAVTTMFTLAIADGRLAVEERVIIRHLADRLGVPERRFEKLLRIAERNTEG